MAADNGRAGTGNEQSGSACAVLSDSTLVAEALATALASRGIEAVGRPLDGAEADIEGPCVVVLAPDGGDGAPAALVRIRELLDGATADRPVHVMAAGDRARPARLSEQLDVPVHGASLSLDDLARLLDGTGTPPSRARGRNGRGHVSDPEAGLVDALTPREREVLRELVGGGTHGEVAEHLGLAVGTVRTHVQAIRAKLSVSSTVEAAAVARRAGLRPPPRRTVAALEETRS